MDKEKLEYFRKKLIIERDNVYELLELMSSNETINSNMEISSELSYNDNHPADIGEEIANKEKGMALKNHQMTVISNIEQALNKIDDGSFGVCLNCKEDISQERLEAIPYAKYCIKCQDDLGEGIQSTKSISIKNENKAWKPFQYGAPSYKENNRFGFDPVVNFNKLPNIQEYDTLEEEYVDPMEKISNEQYKNQLPD